MKKQIEVGSDAWLNLLSEIVDKFKVSETIPHEWFKGKFNIVEPVHSDYEDDREYIEALQLNQFAYMSLMEKLRMELLDQHKYWLVNVRGEGYAILPPKDQVMYAYDYAKEEIRKALQRSNLIMHNVRVSLIPAAQRSKDNDLAMKMSVLKQMVSGFFRKSE